MSCIGRTLAVSAALTIASLTAAHAWQPTKPIEFVVTSGPGGGTDNFARVVQAIVGKYKPKAISTPAPPRAIPRR